MLGQGQMLHRREILTAAGESLSKLPRQSLNNQEAVVNIYADQSNNFVGFKLSLSWQTLSNVMGNVNR